MTTKELEANVEYLRNEGVHVPDEPTWCNKPYSRELYLYTEGGGDFSICVEELTSIDLVIALEDYDVNEETVLWWNSGRGVPFDNIKDLYEDIENWKNKFIKIAEGMPY